MITPQAYGNAIAALRQSPAPAPPRTNRLAAQVPFPPPILVSTRPGPRLRVPTPRRRNSAIPVPDPRRPRQPPVIAPHPLRAESRKVDGAMRNPLTNYTVALRVTLQEADGRTWDEEIREVARFTAEEVRRFRQALADPKECRNPVAYELIKRLDMVDWFEVRDSLGIVVCLESMEEGDQLELLPGRSVP